MSAHANVQTYSLVGGRGENPGLARSSWGQWLGRLWCSRDLRTLAGRTRRISFLKSVQLGCTCLGCSRWLERIQGCGQTASDPASYVQRHWEGRVVASEARHPWLRRWVRFDYLGEEVGRSPHIPGYAGGSADGCAFPVARAGALAEEKGFVGFVRSMCRPGPRQFDRPEMPTPVPTAPFRPLLLLLSPTPTQQLRSMQPPTKPGCVRKIEKQSCFKPMVQHCLNG